MTPLKDRRADKYHAQDAKISTSRYDIRLQRIASQFFFFCVRPSTQISQPAELTFVFSWDVPWSITRVGLRCQLRRSCRAFLPFSFIWNQKKKKKRLRLQCSANAEHWHGPKIMVSLYSFQTPFLDMLTGHLQSHTLHPKWGRTDYEKLLTFTPLGKYNWCTLISWFVFIFRLNLFRDR